MFRGIKTSSGNQTAKLKSIQGITTFVCDEAEEWTNEEEFDKIMLSIRLGGLEILGRSVKVYFFHHLGDDRHTSGNHRITGVKNLMDYLLYRSHFKSQPFNKGGSIERFSRTTPTGDKNYKFFLILV